MMVVLQDDLERERSAVELARGKDEWAAGTTMG
jgi:hypothetical protein